VPIYAYTCERCGPFEERRPMAEASDPASCPSCERQARRLYTPPGLVRTPAALSRALTLDAKSAHEPDVVRAPRGGRPLHRGGHGACGHAH
jgi:putative FmdB family regulatory protein